MKTILALFISFLLNWGVPAQAACSMPLCGAGAGAASSYVGPGDVLTGVTLYYSTSRAFSRATLGNRLVNLCNSTGGVDVLCADASSDATTGILVIPVSLTSFCPGANCTIKIRYDVSGANSCSSAACDEGQATVANREVLTANAVGTRTCGVANGTSTNYGGASTPTATQPYSITAVSKFAGTGNRVYLGFGTGAGFGTQSGSFGFFASSAVLGGTADTSSHAFQSIANSASSFFVTDGSTSSTQSSGGNAGGGLILDADGFGDSFNGANCEVGWIGHAFSGGEVTTIHTNESTFYGTP